MPGLDLAILADERRSAERLLELSQSETTPERYDERRDKMREQASALRSTRRAALQSAPAESGKVRPYQLITALDSELERIGGGIITTEQFAVPQDTHGGDGDPGNNVYIRAAGGSEGYGVGGAIGAKLGAPDTPVVGLVGDGSVYYADSGMWTAVHHRIPVLYVVPNNGAYGIVANAFGGANANMKETGEYSGVVLDGMDPAKIAEGFGVEASTVTNESTVAESIANGLDIVQRENRPYLLNVHLPLGLPEGGRRADPYHLKS
jgi:benzoylformate decarboxylase